MSVVLFFLGLLGAFYIFYLFCFAGSVWLANKKYNEYDDESTNW
tara:strand:+ start:556 stop:687 length:132 start_codon:yes stop_codon:yes gene_type:complete